MERRWMRGVIVVSFILLIFYGLPNSCLHLISLSDNAQLTLQLVLFWGRVAGPVEALYLSWPLPCSYSLSWSSPTQEDTPESPVRERERQALKVDYFLFKLFNNISLSKCCTAMCGCYPLICVTIAYNSEWNTFPLIQVNFLITSDVYT